MSSMTIGMDKIHYFFLLTIPLSWLAVMAASNLTTDQLALLTLRDHMITSESHHILANNWSVTSFVCDWMGVTCGSRHRRVTVLDISNMNLTGTLRPQLGNLSFLISLNISINNFHGELPPDLARLRRLRYLVLDVNNLGGKLPSWFGYLQKLQFLSLANNSFTGFIPTSISNMSNLETLQLPFNSIEGSIPMEFQNLHNLKNLIIDNNQLSGPLPPHIFNISSMEIISLLSNSLSGNLPDNICHGLMKLTWLDLSVNNLAGHIPSTFSQCSLLQRLSLSENYFTGSIPREMGNLTRLERLSLGVNNLKGAIPDEIWNLTMLTYLDFGDNHLTEYGSEGLVSTSIDVYSFGIILMETFSRMKPSDEIFSGDLSLKSWIEDSLPNALQVIDANLVRPEDGHFNDKLESVILIMQLALNCCAEHPRERINMKDVLAKLKKIKHQFLMKVTT